MRRAYMHDAASRVKTEPDAARPRGRQEAQHPRAHLCGGAGDQRDPAQGAAARWYSIPVGLPRQ